MNDQLLKSFPTPMPLTKAFGDRDSESQSLNDLFKTVKQDSNKVR